MVERVLEVLTPSITDTRERRPPVHASAYKGFIICSWSMLVNVICIRPAEMVVTREMVEHFTDFHKSHHYIGDNKTRCLRTRILDRDRVMKAIDLWWKGKI